MSYSFCFVTHASLAHHPTIKRAFGMAGPLTELGHRVSICLEEDESNRAAMEKLDSVVPLWYRPAGLFMEHRQKAVLVAKGQFDVVHICGLGFRNAIGRNANSAGLTVMDHVELESSIQASPKARRVAQYSLEVWSLLHYVEHVVASAYLRDLWQKRCAQWRLKREVLYLPFAYEKRWRERLERSLMEPKIHRFSGKKMFFFMGGFYRAYGCYEMLEALERLLQSREDVVAVLCGRGPEYKSMRESADRKGLAGRIEMPGFVPEAELLEYLSAADVLISPLQDTVTDWARCPSKLYEYMLTQKPIVTCQIGENWRVLGDKGYYYHPGDVASMTAAMKRALEGGSQNYSLDDLSWMARSKNYVQWIEQIRERRTFR
jgi:glycosyltransferase involved in cell wall biosynthesis